MTPDESYSGSDVSVEPNPAVDSAELITRYLTSAPDAVADPYSLWRHVREDDGPVAWLGSTAFAVSWSLSREVVSNVGLFRPASASQLLGDRLDALRATFDDEQQRAYEALDLFESRYVQRNFGQEHTRLRNQAKAAFTPRHVAALREGIQSAVDEMLTAMTHDGELDLREFSYRLPLLVISDMLGVPHDHADRIHAWSTRLAMGLTRGSGELIVDAELTTREFGAYIGGLIDAVRDGQRPPGPLLATLLTSEESGVITRDELVATIVNLLFAGHETTTSLVSIGMYELLRERTQWELLCGDLALVPNAVEELLRYVTPVGSLPRLVTRDAEWGGIELAAGQVVHGVLVAGNRDPQTFEDPDRLDIQRRNAKEHNALGWGPKFCMGAGLARLEGQLVYATLARRFPDMELIDEASLVWRGPSFLRRLDALPVRLGPDRG